MKKLVVFVALLFCVVTVRAQVTIRDQSAIIYENMLQMQREADEEALREADEECAEELVASGLRLIAQEKYKKGFAAFREAWDVYSHAPALFLLGSCYELGIGVDRNLGTADYYYELGAGYDDPNCICAVGRINSDGHLPEAARNGFIAALQDELGIDNDDSLASQLRMKLRECRVCGGTGVCATCHDSWNKSWKNCPSCGDTKKCVNCHGAGGTE